MSFTCKTIFGRIYSQNLFCRHSGRGFMIFYYKLICIFKYSKISTNSAICLDGTVRAPRESKSKYSLSLPLPAMIREHFSHRKCLINLFVIYPKIVYATSLLSGVKKSLFISDSCWAKMLSSLPFFRTGLRFSSQKLMFCFKWSIFSQYSILLEDSQKIYHHSSADIGKIYFQEPRFETYG